MSKRNGKTNNRPPVRAHIATWSIECEPKGKRNIKTHYLTWPMWLQMFACCYCGCYQPPVCTMFNSVVALFVHVKLLSEFPILKAYRICSHCSTGKTRFISTSTRWCIEAFQFALKQCNFFTTHIETSTDGYFIREYKENETRRWKVKLSNDVARKKNKTRISIIIMYNVEILGGTYSIHAAASFE